MPYLHLDVPRSYPVSVKRQLAHRLMRLYADIMETTPDLVHVTFRELGEGGVWRWSPDSAVPSAVLSCEIRRGRPPEQRARLAEALLGASVEALGLDAEDFPVEFTQHAGDEIYMQERVDGVLHGALGRDWSPDETNVPLVESLKEEHRRDRTKEAPAG
jgi:phenylpyruvate tautomerase PptA (4-oxalocrotonate tautomerase family)